MLPIVGTYKDLIPRHVPEEGQNLGILDKYKEILDKYKVILDENLEKRVQYLQKPVETKCCLSNIS